MLPLNLTLLLAILVVAVILWRSKENFMETSYYYEAAPGARGARMICMPESAGSASLGIAVGKAAGDAAAQVAKRACGNMFDVATVDSIVQETKLMATSAAEDATLAVVPEVCKPYLPKEPVVVIPAALPGQQYVSPGQQYVSPGQQYIAVPPTETPRPMCNPGYYYDNGVCKRLQVGSSQPGGVVCPAGAYWDGQGCRYSAQQQCPAGMVWDGKICRAPTNVKTSPGCPTGMIWDGKRCRLPSGAVKTSPGCPTGMIWDGKRCRLPSGATPGAVKTSPGCPAGMIWDGKGCRKPSGAPRPGAVKTSPGCPAGMVWDGKGCRKPSGAPRPGAVKTSPGCPAGMVWDGKGCRRPSTAPRPGAVKVKTSQGCSAGLVWDGKGCRKPVKTSPGCATGKVWNARSRSCVKPTTSKARPGGKRPKERYENFEPAPESAYLSPAIEAAIRDPSRPNTQ